MRPIVLTALVAVFLGAACGLALGLSAADAVEQSVERHALRIESAVSR